MAAVRALDLFSGIGGMALAVHAAFPGLTLLRLCESNEACRAVLSRRFPGVPCESDVEAMRGDPGENVQLVYGGFPCQDVSTAGRGLGVERGARSCLFSHVIRLAGECRAPFILMENVAALERNGLDVVCARLEAAGYVQIRWVVLSADAVGLRHIRRRLFLAARNPSLGDAPGLSLSLRPLDDLMPLREEPPGSRLQPRPPRRRAGAWQSSVHMLGNTCVPRQGLAAIRVLFGIETLLASGGDDERRMGMATELPAAKAWAETADTASGQRQPICFLPGCRDRSALARTLIASDSLHVGGRVTNRRPSGEYASMSTPRWVRHNPEAGTWGTGTTVLREPSEDGVMSIAWAEWFMGFPEGWVTAS